MWTINESTKVVTEMSGRVSLLLNPDKPLSPYHVSYPIVWTGFINNNPIEIIQISSSSSFMENYEFKIYPEGYYSFQNYIISVIDNCLRKALD